MKPKACCWLRLDRQFSPCVKEMHGMGWGSREPPEPAKEEIGVKPALNAGSP